MSKLLILGANAKMDSNREVPHQTDVSQLTCRNTCLIHPCGVLTEAGYDESNEVAMMVMPSINDLYLMLVD